MSKNKYVSEQALLQFENVMHIFYKKKSLSRYCECHLPISENNFLPAR